jgi:serine/threonine-protein phosphatase 4 regulatory subunit 1
MEDVQLNSGSTADMTEPDSTTPPTEHNGGSMASTLVGDHTGENSDMDADTQVDDEGNPSPEEAAIGRLSSMSLMAAVTASGMVVCLVHCPTLFTTHTGLLSDDTKVSFVNEVEKVGRDPVYFVRREATFALGALAKVVPDELILGSLASELL